VTSSGPLSDSSTRQRPCNGPWADAEDPAMSKLGGIANEAQEPDLHRAGVGTRHQAIGCTTDFLPSRQNRVCVNAIEEPIDY
jgi:hypothetical protein